MNGLDNRHRQSVREKNGTYFIGRSDIDSDGFQIAERGKGIVTAPATTDTRGIIAQQKLRRSPHIENARFVDALPKQTNTFDCQPTHRKDHLQYSCPTAIANLRWNLLPLISSTAPLETIALINTKIILDRVVAPRQSGLSVRLLGPVMFG